jgi:four helix bundle protein
MRKAAISLPSNIAEGYGRKHKAEYQQFLSIAYASLLELETQYLLSL